MMGIGKAGLKCNGALKFLSSFFEAAPLREFDAILE